MLALPRAGLRRLELLRSAGARGLMACTMLSAPLSPAVRKVRDGKPCSSGVASVAEHKRVVPPL